ncbi:MAG: endo-1,4-beta-xylanase [Planctomycetota bacterium]|jgi:GH35 family endo-1,4-beta-xylanase
MYKWILGGTVLAFAAVARAEDSTTTYGGRNADASWREEARARIERIRKAPLKIQVVDAQGKPIRGAKVHVEQQRHAFGFGNILNPNAFQLEGDDGRMYRGIFAEHFNKTTFESGFRWHNWYRPAREGRLDEHTKLLERMIAFCQSHDVGIRGHYLAWAPLNRDFYKPTDYRKHPDKLWPELSAHIDEMLAFTDGRLAEWDAINHIVGWNDTMATVTGSNEIYAKIIRHARSKTDTPLWVNEGQILPGGSRVEAYEELIRHLFENEAAPDGIGFMAHFGGGSLRSVDGLWQIYDRFAKFGVPLQLTEFDIDTRDEQLQADYLRDLMTVTFSHPSLSGIVMWGFWEGRHWRPNGALWRRDWSIKPSGKMWKELVFTKWWTDEDRTTDASGLCEISAFLGDYEIVVEHADHTATTGATVENSGTTATIRF